MIFEVKEGEFRAKVQGKRGIGRQYKYKLFC